jgi:hypothetical protein
MAKIILEIEQEQAGELIKAIAMRIEYAKDWRTEQELTAVATQIEKKAEQIGLRGARGALANTRYPIKKVSISFYETNPKIKPEGL